MAEDWRLTARLENERRRRRALAGLREHARGGCAEATRWSRRRQRRRSEPLRLRGQPRGCPPRREHHRRPASRSRASDAEMTIHRWHDPRAALGGRGRPAAANRRAERQVEHERLEADDAAESQASRTRALGGASSSCRRTGETKSSRAPASRPEGLPVIAALEVSSSSAAPRARTRRTSVADRLQAGGARRREGSLSSRAARWSAQVMLVNPFAVFGGLGSWRYVD